MKTLKLVGCLFLLLVMVLMGRLTWARSPQTNVIQASPTELPYSSYLPIMIKEQVTVPPTPTSTPPPPTSTPPTPSVCATGPDACFSPDGTVPADCRIYSPDGRLYVQQIDRTTSRFGVFDASRGEQVNTFTGDTANDLKSIAFSPDSRQVALLYHYSHTSNQVRLIDNLLGTPTKTSLPVGRTYFHRMRFIALKYLVFCTSGSESSAAVYDIETGRSCSLIEWRANGGTCPAAPTPTFTHTPTVTSTPIPPTSTWTPTPIPPTPTWTPTPTPTSIFAPRPDACYSPHGAVLGDCRIYSPDDRLYVQQMDPATGQFVVFDVATQEQVSTFVGDTANTLKAMAFSPDSLQVALFYHYGHMSNQVELVNNLLETPTKTSLPIGGPDYHWMVYAAPTYLAFSSSSSENNAVVYSTLDDTSCTLAVWRANGGTCPAGTD